MKTFKTYEDVIDHFWENTPCHKYPYGEGIGLYSEGEDLGGVIEVQDNGVINIWSGLGFEEYQFKTKAKNPQHAYMIIKLLTSGVEWEVGGNG